MAQQPEIHARTSQISAGNHSGTRDGKILVMLAILFPMLFGIAALVFDCGLMMHYGRKLQHVSDAAAMAAAMDLKLGHDEQAQATATAIVQAASGIDGADVELSIPPSSGAFAGRDGYVEVRVALPYASRFIQLVGAESQRTVRARSVAGFDDVTAGAAIVVLDPDPTETSIPPSDEILQEVPSSGISDEVVAQLGLNGLLAPLGLGGALSGITSRLTTSLNELLSETIDDVVAAVVSDLDLPSLPTLIAGLEVEGLGTLRVDGAIHVNNEWGGVDENGELVGESSQLPHAIACMPILPTTRVTARDIRVVGGVDRPENYSNFDPGKSSPLQANRLPVPDPYASLPIPSVASDPSNANATVHSPAHAVVVCVGPTSLLSTLPIQLLQDTLGPLPPLIRTLLQPLLTPAINSLVDSLLTPPPLQPGVYESITVISLGEVEFEPGIYVIRGKSPYTQMSLAILGGWVQADGVLFYVTDSPGFDSTAGLPDSNDPGDAPPNSLLTSVPSVLIAPLLPGSVITALQDAGSPFDGMLIFQRRLDRRPIILGANKLLGGGGISGTIYAKWAHMIFIGGLGSYDLRFVTGTLRILTVFDTTIAPTTLLPPAQDVLLVE